MHKSRRYFVAIALLGTGGLWGQVARPRTSANSSDVAITAVSGESWLIHLNRSFGDTSMGKTGRLGPPPGAGENSSLLRAPVSTPSPRGVVTLHGSDLYRLNCRGCHEESGLGAPPEINSVINPVRATSVPLVLERMKNAGMDISYADAAKLAQQSKAALLERLHKGGENMPAFPHLSEAEIRPLLAYLKQLSNVPGAGSEQSSIEESPERIGELIVKSTCHTCHSATGPDPEPRQMSAGAIPPLSALTARKSLPEFIRKVTQGSPVLMGDPASLCRGRMPVFYYLTEEEAADVYRYLTLYPPAGRLDSSPLMAASLVRPGGSSNRPDPPARIAGTNSTAAKETESTGSADLQRAALPWTEALVALMLGAGLTFTFREFKRLSAKGGGLHETVPGFRIKPGKATPMGVTGRPARSALSSNAKRSSQ